MGLPQAAFWKTVSDNKEIASLEKHGVFKLVPIPSGKTGAITISQKDYTEDAIQPYGMEGCNSACTPGVGPELSLNQPEEKLLNEEEKRRYQGNTGAVHIFHTSHLLRHPLRGQPAGEGHVQARENSHRGGQSSASLLGRVHRLLNRLKAGRLPAFCLLGYQLGQQPRQGQVYVIIHRDVDQRPNQLQGGTAGTDRTVHNRGRACGGSSDNKGDDVLLQHDVGAGLG